MSLKKKQLELTYKYPPDFEKATKHRLAMRIFKGVDKDQSQQECECCERRIGVDQEVGKCCFDNMEVAFLGPGIPLFFTFLKNSIILLILLTIVYAVYAIYTNTLGDDCDEEDACSGNFFDRLAIINKVTVDGYLTIQNYTVLVFVLVFIIAMQGFRYSFRKVQDDCDDAIDSPSDYAMILRRLPEETQKQDIQQMINRRRGFLTDQQRRQTQNLRVISIVMSYGMGDYTQVKQRNLQKFYQCLEEEKLEEFQPEELPPLDKTSTIAIVVFARQESKQLFKYKPNFIQKFLQCMFTPCIPKSDYLVKGQNVAIERAPEPDDIIWENAGISMGGAIARKSLYSFLSILMLFAGGAVQYGLAVASTKASEDSGTQLIMSTVSSITVSVLNAIIQFFLVFTSEKQRNQTRTEYNTVLMVKISFFQFLNTGVFVIAANFLADMKNFSLSEGLVFEICQVMMLNALVPNILLVVLAYCEVPLKVQRCLTERGTLKKSQLESNYLWQGPAAEIPYKYAYIFKTIWLSAFYAPLAPLVVPISIFGLIINYIIEKCLYGKSYSIPNLLSSMLNDSAIELLEYFPLILTTGQFVIYLYIRNFHYELMPQVWGYVIIASLVISVLNLLLPMDALNNKLWSMPTDNFVYPSYEKVQEKFQVTYEMTNPGYVCDRKRKRDIFMMHNLFSGPTEMTNMGLFTQGNENNNIPLINAQNGIYGPPNAQGQNGPGQPPHGQPPHGQPPHGQPPHGQPPHGQPPHGQHPPLHGNGNPPPPHGHGHPPFGQGPPPSGNNGQNPSAGNPFGAFIAGAGTQRITSPHNASIDQNPNPSALSALAGIKSNNSGNKKPLKMGMGELDEETLNRQNQDLNMTKSHYVRDQNSHTHRQNHGENQNILNQLNQGQEGGINSQGLGHPPPGFGHPPPGFGHPPPGFGHPPPGFGHPPPGFGHPPPGFGHPPPGFGHPPPGFGHPPPGFGHPAHQNIDTIKEDDISMRHAPPEEQYGSVKSIQNKQIKKQLKRSFKIPQSFGGAFKKVQKMFD